MTSTRQLIWIILINCIHVVIHVFPWILQHFICRVFEANNTTTCENTEGEEKERHFLNIAFFVFHVFYREYECLYTRLLLYLAKEWFCFTQIRLIARPHTIYTAGFCFPARLPLVASCFHEPARTQSLLIDNGLVFHKTKALKGLDCDSATLDCINRMYQVRSSVLVRVCICSRNCSCCPTGQTDAYASGAKSAPSFNFLGAYVDRCRRTKVCAIGSFAINFIREQILMSIFVRRTIIDNTHSQMYLYLYRTEVLTYLVE
jgi:hypothetical protein